MAPKNDIQRQYKFLECVPSDKTRLTKILFHF